MIKSTVSLNQKTVTSEFEFGNSINLEFYGKCHYRGAANEDETNSCVSEKSDKDNKDVSIKWEDEVAAAPTGDTNDGPPNCSDENQSFSNHTEHEQCSLFFNDQERTVDYVLVWKELLPYERDDRTVTQKDIDEMKRKEESRSEKRETFEENLILEGLELERCIVDDEIHFVKIHAPLDVLRRYAEILKLRLPMKEVSLS